MESASRFWPRDMRSGFDAFLAVMAGIDLLAAILEGPRALTRDRDASQ